MTASQVSTTPTPPSGPAGPERTRWHRYISLAAGRRSKWVVLGAWLVLVVIGGAFASKLNSVSDNDTVSWLPNDAQSTRAVKIAEQRFTTKGQATAVVVYRRAGGLGPADLAKIDKDRTATATAAYAHSPEPAGPGGGRPDHTGPTPVTLSQDRQAAFFSLPVPMAKNDNAVLGDAVKAVRGAATRDAPPGLEVRITGQAGTISDFIDVYSGMDGALLGAALGVVAILLLLTYRSPVLWLIPLLSVGLAAQIAAAVVYLLAKHAGLHVDGQSSYILYVLAVGVGTDYALLLIARYREELRRHTDRHEAMAFAMSRSLPAIAASAATVAIATLCLVFGEMNSTRGLGPVVAVTVVTVFIAMTSLLPAILVAFGRWIFWPAVPRAGRDHTARPNRTGVWERVAGLVARRPRTIWTGTALLLVALALGSLGLHTGQTQAEQFTKTTDSVAGQAIVTEHFPAGSSEPADVYVPEPATGKALAAAQRTPGVHSAAVENTAGGWMKMRVVLNAPPDTKQARAAVVDLRHRLKAAVGSEAIVGGQSAVAVDISDAQAAEEKLLIPLILAVVLIMLTILLRAVTAPIMLLASVVLSYGAAVGGAALLFKALDHPRIDRGLLLFGFLFLVALGVDYTIFLMSRAREEVRTLGHRAGMLDGLTVTGGVITSAGLVLAATFSVMAVIPTVGAMQQGLLIAGGVLLDTFLVRSLLVPALALDIGPHIWWPSRLTRRP